MSDTEGGRSLPIPGSYWYSRPTRTGTRIDLKVILAVGRGFNIICEEDQEVEQYVGQLVNHLRLREMLQTAVSDMLIYGQAYFEKVRTTEEEKQEQESLELAPIEKRVEAGALTAPHLLRDWSLDDFDSSEYKDVTEKLEVFGKDLRTVDNWIIKNRVELEVAFSTASQSHERFLAHAKDKLMRWKAWSKGPKKRYKGQLLQRLNTQPVVDVDREQVSAPISGELVELKPLDPLWMRINRDAFGNVTGFVQWGLTPIPQAIIAEKLVFLRWMPKSWAHENAYGTSILMPVQRQISFFIQAEEDMKVFWHQYAKPMLVVAGGTPDKPYPAGQLTGLQNKFAARQPNTDAVVPGDVKVEMLQSGARNTAMVFEVWEKYLREKIYETIGIPSILMNLPGEITRATSDVTLQAFIAEEKMIQEMSGEGVMKQIIEPEVRMHFADKYPDGNIPVMKIMWPPVLEEDRNKKIDRLTKSVGKPFETVNEARSEAGLEPMDDPQYDLIPEAAAPGFGAPPSQSPELSAASTIGPREEGLQKQDRQVSPEEPVR